MAEPFIPFVPNKAPLARVPESSAQLKVLPPAEGAPSFKPVSGSSAHLHNPSGSSAAQPKITLQRDGEKITSIRIECVCGQVIDLACSY